MIDALWIACIICIGAGMILAYLFGHYRGFEAAFDVMHEAHGDVPHVPTEQSHFGTPFNTGAK